MAKAPVVLIRDLLRICDQIDIRFFYPVIYRVDIDKLDADRLTQKNSALKGSNEYLIDPLLEDEFELLFLDFVSETAMDSKVSAALTTLWNKRDDALYSGYVLAILERWCIK